MSANLTIEAERIARLCEALSLASRGAFADAAGLLDDPSADAVGELERRVRSLVIDYQLSIKQSALAVDEFTAAQEQLRAEIETVRQQQLELRALAAPIIDVGEHTVAVSMAGVTTRERAEDMTERLLRHIHETGTRWVILDLTGIEQLDSLLAAQLVKTTTALRLMGAECLLTGMPPKVAQTLTSLGASLEGLITLARLRDGLRYCQQRSAAR